jgi:hypothetical protein
VSDATPMPKPTVWDELFPGRFLRAGLLKGKDATLTIREVFLERMPNDKGVEEVRGILSFDKTDKQLAINKTNGLALRAMFGPQVQSWIGKRVTLYPTQDRFGGKMVDAIRVRGSPDIAESITIEIKFLKKKAQLVTLQRTGAKAEAAPAPEPAPVSAPE